MNFQLVFRNMLRSRWRTFLTVGGVAVATALMIWSEHMMAAFLDQIVRGATQVELGQIQIHNTDYIDKQNFFYWLDEPAASVETIEGTEGVKAASGRVITWGQMGTEEVGEFPRIMGVDPAREAAVTGLDGALKAGAWLSETPPRSGPREIVLGRDLAEQIQAKPGDEFGLIVFLTADGAGYDETVVVKGVVGTGSSMLDRLGAYMHIKDLQYMTLLEGRIHEIAIATTRGADLDDTRARIVKALWPGAPDDATKIARSGEPVLSVRTWPEIIPEMFSMIELARASMKIFYFILLLIAGLGILNVQRMSALERKREFGVQLAVGVTPWRMWRTIVAEATLVTAIGAALGALLGVALSAYHASAGLSLGERFSYMGVAFDDRLYFALSPDAVAFPVGVMLWVGALCGVWPAIKSARLDAARAIAGRT